MNNDSDSPDALDVHTLERLVIDALERTAFLLADPCEDPESLAPAEIHACIEFCGPELGGVGLGSTRAFARNLAASLLGVEPSDVSDAQTNEALRELANIVGGSVISALGGENCAFSLGLPHIGKPDLSGTTTTCVLDAEGERLEIACHRHAA